MTKFEEKKKEAYEKASMKSYGNTAGSMQMRHLLNELENVGLLKEQQAPPVVPECVAELFNEYRLENIQRLFEFGIDDIKSNKMIKALMWRDKHPDTFSLAFITGKYEVEKPQLFYLKNKLTGMWLMRDEVDEVYPYDHTFNRCHRGKFTQQEIDSMQTGSYELVPVEEGK
ncbi:DUF1642 domain-containing protein [Lactococcus lactis]|uniref:DUF1642 domain-containing protein n=1 Tax=Lactococcus lactis TaxID=1358 RepID=UPI00071C7986|nr:DUF1642 domain-containing protein [Lactococcus lactis]KSU11080.1 prophage pi3 protein 37 [Lactococcus lactis subsp. lactis]